MRWLALDIGGANLKAADGRAWSAAVPFPLWQRPGELAAALRSLQAAAPPHDSLAVTMTGELADCFATKAEGVRAIVDAVETSTSVPVSYYQVGGSWADAAAATAEPLRTAAANWHALAALSSRYLAGDPGLLIDVGSTTCDVIPLVEGQPAALGQTDPERLAAGELVYTGVVRSPLCAVVEGLPWRGTICPVAHELFATTWDAYLMLGLLAEEPAASHTADGRPATRCAAHDRLARSLCADRTLFSADDAVAAGHAVYDAQCRLLRRAVDRVIERLPAAPAAVVVSGQGEFLARRVAAEAGIDAVVSLADRLGRALSRAATAHAVAVLANELPPQPAASERGNGPRLATFAAPSLRRVVVKLGGSLLDLPDLIGRLRAWLRKQPPAEFLLVVGGGDLADALRNADGRHRLGEAAAHWLCVDALGIHYRMMRGLLPEAAGWPGVEAILSSPPAARLVLVDAERFVRFEEARHAATPLPATWAVTTDSIAARLASIVGAGLVLLKSRLPETGASRERLAQTGYVDAHFPIAAAELNDVRYVDLRGQP